MKYAVYGTVYNNVDTVEATINSIFDPKYEIVIVDNYSTDGTYEKLLQLRKEFNLKIFRFRCNRGMGKDYAIRKCSDGSRTAFVDFDVVYNKNFHKLLLSDVNKLLACTEQYTFYVNKNDVVRNGGWRNLNAGEIEDFLLRVGIDATAPVIIGANKRVGIRRKRELRYSGKYQNMFRNLITDADWIRGGGLYFKDIKKNMGLNIHQAALCYTLARLKGIYRYDEKFTNFSLLAKRRLDTLINPKKLGICDSSILFYFYPPKGMNLEKLIDERVRERWGFAYKYTSLNKLLKEDMLVYVKRRNAVKIIPKTTMNDFLSYPPMFLHKI